MAPSPNRKCRHWCDHRCPHRVAVHVFSASRVLVSGEAGMEASPIHVSTWGAAIRQWHKRLVRAIGLEPTLPCGNWNLNPARLPVSPRPRADRIIPADLHQAEELGVVA